VIAYYSLDDIINVDFSTDLNIEMKKIKERIFIK
jgi:hypothetical protein